MVDGIEKIDVLIHQLSQLEEDLDKLSDDRRETARAEIQKVRAEIVISSSKRFMEETFSPGEGSLRP